MYKHHIVQILGHMGFRSRIFTIAVAANLANQVQCCQSSLYFAYILQILGYMGFRSRIFTIAVAANPVYKAAMLPIFLSH
jgi:hypothetical protein